MRKPTALIQCEEAATAAGWQHTTVPPKGRSWPNLEPIEGHEFTASLDELVITARWELNTETNRQSMTFASVNCRKDLEAAAKAPHVIKPTGYQLRKNQVIDCLEHPEKARRLFAKEQA